MPSVGSSASSAQKRPWGLEFPEMRKKIRGYQTLDLTTPERPACDAL